MPQELVRNGSKAATVDISLMDGVKHGKTSLNARATHEQCWLYTDVYSFYVVTGHVFRRCVHNSFIFWTRRTGSENWHDWDGHNCGWQGRAGNFAPYEKCNKPFCWREKIFKCMKVETRSSRKEIMTFLSLKSFISVFNEVTRNKWDCV